MTASAAGRPAPPEYPGSGEICAEARRRLYGGALFPLCLGFLCFLIPLGAAFALTFLFGGATLSELVQYAAGSVTAGELLTAVLPQLIPALALTPAAAGLCRFIYAAAAGDETVGPEEVFRSYLPGPRNTGRALYAAAVLALTGAAGLAVCRLAGSVWAENFSVPAAVASAGLIPAAFAFSHFGHLTLYFSDRGCGVFRAFARSCGAMRGNCLHLAALRLRFAGWFALGAAAFGLPLIVWVLPYYGAADSLFCFGAADFSEIRRSKNIISGDK